ncbi:MAG: site-specific DNA-methyltransferase [Desulfobacteraceae bacterium]|nr:site-specific DNA-methyltransferase [Desulfobacteraceae bacterium]MBC2756291.1 site-specific DNA-methyltransferase [Desulfobacteraceae bacterium]
MNGIIFLRKESVLQERRELNVRAKNDIGNIGADVKIRQDFDRYVNNKRTRPFFIHGDSLGVLKQLPSESIDCCVTSPPYWGKRQYATKGIGLEKNYKLYVKSLVEIFIELRRVLKKTGSFWLNIGDSYKGKKLLGIPWRVAFELTDNHGWTLRNDVIWNKVKGGLDNTKDRLGNVYEHVFHFVKQEKGYFYDADAIRSKPSESKVVNGAIVSATGVSGVRYKRQIELSTDLSCEEKKNAFQALENLLQDMRDGKLSDFRMIIRNQQRTTHSDSIKVSGRAKELKDKGFYFLKYHPNGSKPRDLWDIIPEDTQKRKGHYAPYPVDLCRIPILATCPEGGIVIDPFVGTGTTTLTAMGFNRKSVGIDISDEYIQISQNRCVSLF